MLVQKTHGKVVTHLVLWAMRFTFLVAYRTVFWQPLICTSYVLKKIHFGGNLCVNGCMTSKLMSQVVTVTQPPPRYNHSANVAGDKIIVVGGANSYGRPDTTCHADIWMLHVTSKTWQKIILDEGIPPAIGFHTSSLIGTQLILIGGGSHDSSYTNDIFILDFSDIQRVTGRQLKFLKQDSEEESPTSLYGSSVLTCFPDIFTFGGSIDWDGLTRLSGSLKKYTFTCCAPSSLQELCLWHLKRSRLTLNQSNLPEDLLSKLTEYLYDGDQQPNKVDWKQ